VTPFNHLLPEKNNMAKIKLKASINAVSMTGGVTVKIKSSLSSLHLQSAAYFSRKSAECEKKQNVTERLRSEHRAYVTGAITLSIASLESSINELFLEAVHENRNIFKHLQPNVPDLLRELWSHAERFSILEKYQLVLAVSEKEKFDKGSSPYREVDSAIRLRNALVHYKPEWDTELKEHKKIETRLSKKFHLNPFTKPNQAFFPHRCLSHGCAEWIVKSCISFIEDFYQRLELPPRWEKEQKDLLKTI